MNAFEKSIRRSSFAVRRRNTPYSAGASVSMASTLHTAISQIAFRVCDDDDVMMVVVAVVV